jgi:hypothetical protein
MSLKLNFDICQSTSCKWFSFKETTGIYDEDTNTTGWGDPNPEVTDYAPLINSDAALTVTLPNSTDSIDIDLSDYFPSNDNSFSINITNEDLGLSENTSLPSGIYKFTYTLTIDSSTYSKTKYVLISCEIECKINNILADLVIEQCCLECDNEDLDKVLYLKTLLCIAKSAAECGNINRAEEALETINDLLEGDNNCNC